MGKSKKHSFFSKTINTLDSFGDPVHLTLNKQRAITSQLGGILTIVLAIIIFSQATSQFVNMVNHKNPKLYQLQDLEETPSIVNFNKTKNFFLAVVLLVDSVPINITAEAPFNFPTYDKKYRTQEDGTIVENNHLLLWAPCNQSDFPDEIYGEETFTSISLQMGYCAYGINYLDTTTGICPENIFRDYPDCVTPLDMEIQGDSSSDKYDFIQANFKICDQSDSTLPSGITCTSDNMIETFETNTYEVNLYFASTSVNMLNYDTPNKTFIEEIYWKLNPNISKTADIYVDKITVEDSDSYLSSNENNRSYYNVNSGKVRETERYLTTRTTKFLQWNMKRSNTNLVVSRTYAKIPDILTDLGGFSKSAFFVVAFLVVGYVRYKYQILLANGLYDFVVTNNESKEKAAVNGNMTFSSMDGLDSGQNNASVLESSSRSVIPTSNREQRNAPNNKQVIDYFEKLNKRGKLDDSEWSYLKSFLCCCRCRKNPQTLLAEKARKFAINDLDLIWSGKKMVEFKILKTLILNANQREVFEFFENPLLTLDDQQTLKQIKKLRASASPPASASTAPTTLTIKSKDLNFSFSQATKNLAEGGFDNEGETPSNLKKLKLKQRGRLTKSKAITDDQQLVDYRRRTKRTMSITSKPSENEDAFSSLSNYGRLYMAYRHLKEDENPSNRVINLKLIYSLSPDLRKVFKKIDQILGDDYTVEQFEQVVENILEAPNCLLSIRK